MSEFYLIYMTCKMNTLSIIYLLHDGDTDPAFFDFIIRDWAEKLARLFLCSISRVLDLRYPSTEQCISLMILR